MGPTDEETRLRGCLGQRNHGISGSLSLTALKKAGVSKTEAGINPDGTLVVREGGLHRFG